MSDDPLSVLRDVVVEVADELEERGIDDLAARLREALHAAPPRQYHGRHASLDDPALQALLAEKGPRANLSVVKDPEEET